MTASDSTLGNKRGRIEWVVVLYSVFLSERALHAYSGTVETAGRRILRHEFHVPLKESNYRVSSGQTV